MDTTDVKKLTPAERAYEQMKKASRNYYRRKNPDIKKRGRPLKNIVVPVENELK